MTCHGQGFCLGNAGSLFCPRCDHSHALELPGANSQPQGLQPLQALWKLNQAAEVAEAMASRLGPSASGPLRAIVRGLGLMSSVPRDGMSSSH